MKIKILYIVSTLQKCGPTNQLSYIIKNINRDKFDIYLLTLNGEPTDTELPYFETLGVNIFKSEIRNHLNIFSVSKHIRSVTRLIQPDIIHTQGLRPDVLTAYLIGDNRHVSTLRSFPQLDYGMEYPSIIARIITWQHLRALAKMDKVVTVSHAVQNNLEAMLPSTNIQTIANSYERARSPAGNKGIGNLQRLLNTGIKKRIFLTAGGLINRKDPLWLINFWRKYFHNDDSKQLVFIGDGPLMSNCLNLASQSTNISLLGHVDNVGDYYDVADALISVSHAEGLPNAVIEALSHETPCILSSIEPHCEISESLPHMVHLYDLGVEQSLHEVIIGSEFRKVGPDDGGEFNTVEKTFSVKTMATQYEDLYVSLY